MTSDSTPPAGISPFRGLPSVDRLLNDPRLIDASSRHSRTVVVDAVRAVLDETRDRLARGDARDSLSDLVDSILARCDRVTRGTLHPAINATGVIIHTNLGRAPLSDEALAAMAEVSRGYSNLEYDLEAGERGSRYVHVAELLCRLTGAEAALAVNNNAAAVLLALSTLASGREVVIARGQLVEIGGGFRVPDVMRQSGAHLVEVGTTNRTYPADFAAATTADTALFLRVHPSNFQVIGFTREATLAELVEVGRTRSVPVMDDLGSGALLDTSAYGLAREPMPQDSIAAGVALVCFSGDKLLGGPQAGIILGKKDLLDWIKRNPLARAVRLDKASLAGLQATLLHYLKGEANTKIPIWRMIAASLDEIEERGRKIAATLPCTCEIVDARATVGGGSLPGETLASRAVSLTREDVAANELAARLRRQQLPVITRVEHDRVLLDLRTVLPWQDELLVEMIRRAVAL